MTAAPISASTGLLEAALGYAREGTPVFPCRADNKRPITSHGFKEASTDERTVRAWWTRYPDAMIGAPTGKASGAWVLDVDDPATFEANCPVELPVTRRSETGKGYHLHFANDPSLSIRNAQRDKRGWPIDALPGAEVRGDGGYIILPPSRHPSGRLYRWSVEMDPVPAPRELLGIVNTDSRRERAAPAHAMPHRAIDRGDTAYGLAALDTECAAVRAAGNGEQEGTLNSAALKIGSLCAGKELTLGTARARLVAAGLAMSSYSSSDPWTLQGVVEKVERGLQDGAVNPRSAPDQQEAKSTVVWGAFRHADDPGWQEMPDWAQGTEEPGHEPAASAARSDEIHWPEPVDLWARHEEPPLPAGVLPELIERFATRQASIMGCDPAGLAMAALTVCAAAIPDSISLQVKQNDPTWQEHARLWVALVGPPSRKKTPIFKAAIAPLRRLDNELMRSYTEQLRALEALPKTEQKGQPRPKQRRLIISDTTVEAAQEVLKDSPDGLLSEQDELSGWFGAMDKYAPGKGNQADRAFWLKSFNGGTYNLNRIARGATQIPNLSICLLGGIQPEPIRKLAGESVDDGLLQRLLPVVLRPSSVGQDVPNDEVVREYGELVEKLHRMEPLLRRSFGGSETEVPLQFDIGARTIRERLEREHLALVEALETVSPKLASHYGKYDGIFARLCLLWHCIDNASSSTPPGIILEDVAERVSRFMEDFIRPSAIAFYAGLLGMSAGHEELVSLASWIVAKRLEEVKARDAQRSSQSFRSLTGDQFRAICEKLEAFGWLERTEPGPKSITPRWLVNPRVHEAFAQRAELEEERRQAAREALQSALGG